MNAIRPHSAPARPQRRPAREHSGIGIAAFVVALVVMLLAMLAVPFGLFLKVLPHLLGLSTGGDGLLLGAIGALTGLDLLAAGLAAMALRRPEDSRVFPMIALVIALLTLCAIGLVVGLAALALRA